MKLKERKLKPLLHPAEGKEKKYRVTGGLFSSKPAKFGQFGMSNYVVFIQMA
jgi:hypothetical protein